MWSDVGRLLILAAIGEATWQTLKLVWEPNANRKLGKFHPDKIGALAVGVLIAFGSGLDLPAMVGIPMSIPYLGIILTGVLISRGAGFVHDLLTYLKSLKEIVLNKADTANIERNASIKVDPKNLPDGAKITMDIPKGTATEHKPIMGKTKEMLMNLAGTAERIVKVVRSTPAVKTEVESKVESDANMVEREGLRDDIVKEGTEVKEGESGILDTTKPE